MPLTASQIVIGSPIPALATLLLALLVAHLLAMRNPDDPTGSRFVAIDGIRGYLALAVFLHHATTWYGYLRHGDWMQPASLQFKQFAIGAVMLFFMITAFLFTTKLLNARGKPLAWSRLFVGRFMRLTPLYAFAMLGLLVIVFYQSGYSLHQPLLALFVGIATWASFTVFGMPDLNGVAHTSFIISYVTWSLVYEWFFYCSLPLMALLLRIRVGWRPLLVSAIALTLFVALGKYSLSIVEAFAIGSACAVLVRSPNAARSLAGPVGTVVVMLCAVAFYLLSPRIYSSLSLALLAPIFACVACGNTLFGLLALRASRLLGEMAYSLYLLHGLLIFVVFNDLIDHDTMIGLSPFGHWLLIMACTPVLIVGCYLSYRWIEKPGIAHSERVYQWLHRLRLPSSPHGRRQGAADSPTSSD